MRGLLACVVILTACGGEQASIANAATPVVSDFLRYVEAADGSAALEAAVVSYQRADGTRVDLVAAVHLGDRSYYAALQTRFRDYDALLYELVAPERGDKPAKGGSDSIVSRLQRFMSEALELEFQLEGIDYQQPNFVHADLTVGEFQQLSAEKGESLWTLVLRMMAAQYAAQQKDEGPQVSALAMLMTFALGGKERAQGLKRMLAREFENIEMLVAGIEPKEPGKESVLLGERNKAALRVLSEQLAAGKRQLAIFYGAAHMPDFEARLQRDFGFRKVAQEWLPAWRVQAR